MDSLPQFISELRQASNMMRTLGRFFSTKLKTADLETMDVLHKIELSDLDVISGFLLCRQLKEIRLRRRQAKDNLDLLNLFQFSGFWDSFRRLQTMIGDYQKRIGKRCYSPRVLDDLFDSFPKTVDMAGMEPAAASDAPETTLESEVLPTLEVTPETEADAIPDMTPDASKAVELSAQKVPDVSKAVNAPAQKVPDASKAVDLPVQKIPDASKAVELPVQKIPDASKAVDLPAQKVPDASKAVDLPAQKVPDASKAVDLPAQKIPDASKAVDLPAQKVSDASKDVSEPPIFSALPEGVAPLQFVWPKVRIRRTSNARSWSRPETKSYRSIRHKPQIQPRRTLHRKILKR